MANFIKVPHAGHMVLINIEHIVFVEPSYRPNGERKTTVTIANPFNSRGSHLFNIELPYEEFCAMLE